MASTAERMYRPVSELVASDHAWGNRSELVLVRDVAETSRAVQARRLLNIIVAAVSLVLLIPLMMLIAVTIKLTSKGPVFFKQTRVGVDRRHGSGGNWRRKVDYGGRLFTIYKFRTMTDGNSSAEVWAMPGDDRVTKVGRFLRTYRLDELPQLINVLKGDMNIVGPRPEQPRIFLELRDVVDRYHERQRVLPGITGWAQINQPYDRNIDDVRQKIRYDLEYARNVSAVRDLKIMLKTVPVVLLGKGGW
ncbi:MAG TPA: sugar transferase [Longimicrobiales bacterium]|nr:sugar transferase [Longimicrobiales bacterium]